MSRDRYTGMLTMLLGVGTGTCLTGIRFVSNCLVRLLVTLGVVVGGAITAEEGGTMGVVGVVLLDTNS